MRPDEAATLRVPPHSVEAEQSVLGGLMLDNAAWNKVGDLVKPQDFYSQEHREVFATIAAMINASKPADVITVFERGGHDIKYLNAMAQSVISASGIRAYAEIVRERAQRRRLIALADVLATESFQTTNAANTVGGLVDGVVSALMALERSEQRSEPEQLEGMLAAFVDHVQAKYEGETDAIETGLMDLDHLLDGGLRGGELFVLGARPRSEERRVEKECAILCRSRWSPYH